MIRMSEPGVREDEAALDALLECVKVERILAEVVAGDPPAWAVLVFYSEPPAATDSGYSEIRLSPEEGRLYERLRQWRDAAARQAHVPPGLILGTRMLMRLAKARPLTQESLLALEGLTEEKAEAYGEEIRGIIGGFVTGGEE